MSHTHTQTHRWTKDASTAWFDKLHYIKSGAKNWIYILLIALSPLSVCECVSVSVCHFAYSSNTKGDRYLGFVAQEKDYLREC